MSIIYTAINNEYALVGDNSTKDCNGLDDTRSSIDIEPNVIIGNKWYEVREIGHKAFYKCKNVSSVSIPNTVVQIDNSAFDCLFISSNIVLPDSLKFIGNYAFASNYYTSIVIPKNVQFIGYGAFSYTKHVNSITVDEGNKYFCVESNILYDIKKTRLIQAAHCLTSIDIPATVRCIDASSLTLLSAERVVIPINVKKIMNIAFQFSNVKTVVIHGNTALFGVCFKDCRQLCEVIYCGSSIQKSKPFDDDISPIVRTCVGYNNDYFGGINVTKSDECVAFLPYRSNFKRLCFSYHNSIARIILILLY